MKVAVCQLPDRLTPTHRAWRALVAEVESGQPDLVVLNELPFGPWIADAARYDDRIAAASVAAHEAGISALRGLPTAVITSRPTRGGERLVNEAILVAGRGERAFHDKQYFPQETGYFEETWFTSRRPGFDLVEHGGVRIGALLCTELMFTEWARHYRRQGAQLIVAPRASGVDMRHWEAAARMAAIVSGCYVLSSNRVSEGADGFDRGFDAGVVTRFGGRGFVYGPGGDLLCETSTATPTRCITIDLAEVAAAQRRYPCTVRELGGPREERGAALKHDAPEERGTSQKPAAPLALSAP